MIRPVLALAALLSLGTLAFASDYTPNAAPDVPGVTPVCQDGWTLHTISSRFGGAENKTFKEGYLIARFDDIQQTRHAMGPGLIERRYCQATTTLNTGDRQMVYYMIESGQGFAGVGSRVEFCVDGFDYWRVHDGQCRTVRPQ